MKNYIIGVDVGGTNTKAALLDLKGRILSKKDFSTGKHTKNGLIGVISSKVDSLIEERGIKKKDILGLGIGLPGLVDFKKGLVFYLTNLPGWKNTPLRALMEKRTSLKTYIDNDVKIMALGELKFGAGKGYENIICLTLGTGVGGAVIIDGEIYRGSSLVAGEIGHMPINEDGPACKCGSFGCLEAYVGREYFLKNVKKTIRKSSPIVKIVNGNLSLITPELLSKTARAGDEESKKAWREMGSHIGSALSGVINLLNPELIVIGGGMSEAGNALFDSIKDKVNEKCMNIQKDKVKIVKAKLGNDAALIGAGELVKNEDIY